MGKTLCTLERRDRKVMFTGKTEIGLKGSWEKKYFIYRGGEIEIHQWRRVTK